MPRSVFALGMLQCRLWFAICACSWLVSIGACDDSAPTPVRRQAPAPEPPPAAAQPSAPAIEGVSRLDANGLLDRIKARAGSRATLVNIWASWCDSCREEIPMLLSLRDLFAADGIDFAFVSADEPAALPRAVELMREWKGPLPILAVAGSMGSFKRAMHPSWRGAMPATFLFDASGKRRYFWEGPVYEHEVTPILQGFLAGEPIDGETRPPLVGGPSPQ